MLTHHLYTLSKPVSPVYSIVWLIHGESCSLEDGWSLYSDSQSG